MTRTRDEILENRRRLKAEYGRLLHSVAELLFRHDPIRINCDVNTDEYLSEAETILPRLKDCRTEDEVLQVVHAEFVRWFDAENAGPREHYNKIASEIWQLWQGYLASEPTPD